VDRGRWSRQRDSVICSCEQPCAEHSFLSDGAIADDTSVDGNAAQSTTARLKPSTKPSRQPTAVSKATTHASRTTSDVRQQQPSPRTDLPRYLPSHSRHCQTKSLASLRITSLPAGQPKLSVKTTSRWTTCHTAQLRSWRSQRMLRARHSVCRYLLAKGDHSGQVVMCVQWPACF
jgi:hypothetical protein